MTVRTHRLTLAVVDKEIWLECERGDLAKPLGATPTPDDVARAAIEHWGRPLGGAQ